VVNPAQSAEYGRDEVLVGYVNQFGEITLDVGLQYRGWQVVLLPPERHIDGT
jgi:hypothetical protein